MFSHIYSKLNLYRRRWFWASAAMLLASLALMAAAAPYQKRTPHKLRATALVELTTSPSGTVSTRVIPVTILADGSFRDASIYESRPRPMALGNGVVYEAQKTGIPVGYITINNGSHTQEGWVAEGRWQPAGQAQTRTTSKPATASANSADDRPLLHREGENPQPQPTPVPAPNDTQNSSQSSPSDSDRPVLHRSDGGGNPNPQPTPVPAPDQSQGSSQPSQSDSDRPVLHRSGGETTTQTTNQPATHPETEPPPDDPNRPVLRRRKPAAPGETETTPQPAPSKTPAVSPTPSQSIKALPLNTPGTQTLVAVSDAQSSDSRSYEFRWKPGEEAQIDAKMRRLALAQLPGENSQLNEHALTNVVVRSFDLDLSNDAVVVITAEVPGGFLAPGGKTAHPVSNTKTEAGKFVSRYVTVIARVDIDGNPQKLAASVTDSSRLDVAPRLELIDAVDVDGDGLAELMFRQYDFDQKSFIIYGIGHGAVTKVFEGASEPIK